MRPQYATGCDHSMRLAFAYWQNRRIRVAFALITSSNRHVNNHFETWSNSQRTLPVHQPASSSSADPVPVPVPVSSQTSPEPNARLGSKHARRARRTAQAVWLNSQEYRSRAGPVAPVTSDLEDSDEQYSCSEDFDADCDQFGSDFR